MAYLETITGNLQAALAKVDRKSIQLAREITNARRTQPELREQWLSVLREEGRVPVTKIYPLNPRCVQVHASAGAIGRVSWLDDFYDGLLFIVLDRDVGAANGFLRAVPLQAAAHREVHGDPLVAAFATVMSQVEAWTPEMYAAFSGAITDHLKRVKSCVQRPGK